MRDKLCLEEATSSVSSHHPDHFPNGPHVRLSHVSAPRGGIQSTDRRALETRGDAFVGERARVEIPDTDSVCVSVAVAGRRAPQSRWYKGRECANPTDGSFFAFCGSRMRDVESLTIAGIRQSDIKIVL